MFGSGFWANNKPTRTRGTAMKKIAERLEYEGMKEKEEWEREGYRNPKRMTTDDSGVGTLPSGDPRSSCKYDKLWVFYGCVVVKKKGITIDRELGYLDIRLGMSVISSCLNIEC